MDNPYLETFRKLRRGEYGMHNYTDRHDLVKKYAWSIPDNDSLALIVEHCAKCGIVEIGAGTGYWAYLLGMMGIAVKPYDIDPPSTDRNSYSHKHEWMPILKGSCEVLKRKVNQRRALMLSWPPYNTDMAYQCLKAYKGDTLIYIGEGPGGCTGDKKFFALLSRDWKCVSRATPPQWNGIHDQVEIYKRRPRAKGPRKTIREIVRNSGQWW